MTKILSPISSLMIVFIYPLWDFLFPKTREAQPMIRFLISSFAIILFLSIKRICTEKEKSRLRKNSFADCKMFFDVSEAAGDFKKIREQVDGGNGGPDGVRIKSVKGGAPSPSSLLPVAKLKCRRVFNAEKAGKCFIQCMFVPLDENGNTLAIRRLDENHPSLFLEDLYRLNNWMSKKNELTFVSFSPIPDYFGQQFDPMDAYHREVKKSSKEPEIEFMGYVLRRCIDRDGSEYHYLMLVYSARYSEVSFLRDDGRFNDVEIGNIFASSKGSWPRSRILNKLLSFAFNVSEAGDTCYFEKDHDDIIGAGPISALRDMASAQRNMENPSDGVVAGIKWRSGVKPKSVSRILVRPVEEAILREFF